MAGAERAWWLGRVLLGLVAGALVGAMLFGVIDGRRGYEISNVRLTTAEGAAGVSVWRVTFDAEWSAFGDPPVHVQPCTVRLFAAAGTLFRERGFGLHVGRRDRDISPPFDFPVSGPDPDRAEVVCSRRG